MTAFLKIPLNDPTLKDMTCSEVMVLCWLENWCEGLNRKVCRLSASEMLTQLPAKMSRATLWRILMSLQEQGLITLTSKNGASTTIHLNSDLTQNESGSDREVTQNESGDLTQNESRVTQNESRHYIKKSEKERGERSPLGKAEDTRLAGGYGASADPGASAERKPESRPPPAAKPNRRPTSKDWQ